VVGVEVDSGKLSSIISLPAGMHQLHETGVRDRRLRRSRLHRAHRLHYRIAAQQVVRALLKLLCLLPLPCKPYNHLLPS
jgi:hypothetical protein